MKNSSKMFRFGGFTVILTAVVLGILVLVNVLYGNLPSSVTQFDISRNSLSKISDATKQIVTALDEDVTIHILCETGQEISGEDGTVISTMLDRYADLSDHIHVDHLDPNTAPNLRKDYDISGSIYYYSMIVESARRSRYIPLRSTAPTQGVYVTYIDYDNYDTSAGDYAKYEQFEAERAITSAIDYVTKDEIPMMYRLTGHGEYEIYDTLKAELTAKNIGMEDLALETAGQIPDDCAVLLLYSPSNDFNENERDAILDYAKKGGKILLVAQDQGIEMPNFTAVTDFFDMEMTPGIVFEGNSDYYSAYYGAYFLMPKIRSHKITDSLIDASYRVALPYASAIKAKNSDADTTVTALLTTSSSAYIKALDTKTLEKEDGDISGAQTLALLAEKAATESGDVPTMVWLTSGYALDCTDANVNLTTNIVNYLVGEIKGIAISAKTNDTSFLVVSGVQSTIWTIIIAGVLPALVLAVGIFVVVRRRRK